MTHVPGMETPGQSWLTVDVDVVWRVKEAQCTNMVLDVVYMGMALGADVAELDDDMSRGVSHTCQSVLHMWHMIEQSA